VPIVRQLAFVKITFAVYKARLSRLKGELVEVKGMIARTFPQYLWPAGNVKRMGGILAGLHENREKIIRKIGNMKKSMRRLRLKLYITVERDSNLAAQVRNYKIENQIHLAGFWARAIAAAD
jgi:hypothetical protein